MTAEELVTFLCFAGTYEAAFNEKVVTLEDIHKAEALLVSELASIPVEGLHLITQTQMDEVNNKLKELGRTVLIGYREQLLNPQQSAPGVTRTLL